MKSRREKRTEAVINLYQYDLLENNLEILNIDFSSEENHLFFDLLSKLNEIDLLIGRNLVNYSLSRLALLDKSIIRLATYEMKYTDVPHKIIINEAIEITKKYCDLDDQKQHKFTNSVLDSISKEIISGKS